jgi:putative ABC transport system substrate-binding protein
MCKPVASLMLRKRAGSILNISSISGVVGMKGQTNYSSSKAGMVGFTKALAKELVELKPDCIVGHSTPVVTALMQATRTIPIVFVSVSDPVGSGFVASMARPAGNMTGFTILPATITGKYLSMLKEMMPQLASVAILYNPDSAPAAGTFFLTPFVGAARDFKIQPITAQVRNPAEIESTIAKLGSEPRSGLIVMPDNFTSVHRKLIISLAAQFRIPTIYPYRYFAEEGGLLSYGVNTSDVFRRAAEYVSRILRGAKPADLPVQAPTKFELVINLGAAKALGLVMPRALLAKRRSGNRVKRRQFIGLVGGAAAWPLTASAQRSGGKIVTIGILAIEPWPPIDTFRHALNDLGYIEGKNVRFEYRYAKGHNERLPELANDLVGLNVDVIVTWGTDAVLAAKQATTTIPIVMGAIGDPSALA